MPSFGSKRQHGTLEPVDECFLSGWLELTADMDVTNAPGALRVERQETAALGARCRHSRHQADAGARRNQRKDARKLIAFEDCVRRDPDLAACRQCVVSKTVPLSKEKQPFSCLFLVLACYVCE